MLLENRELAGVSLIRPSTTCGHIGDVVGDKPTHDAPTAQRRRAGLQCQG